MKALRYRLVTNNEWRKPLTEWMTMKELTWTMHRKTELKRGKKPKHGYNYRTADGTVIKCDLEEMEVVVR